MMTGTHMGHADGRLCSKALTLLFFCSRWQDDRLQTCDVLRDSGAIFNGSALLSALLSDERGGSAVDLDEAEVKSVAEALKLALCSLSPPVAPRSGSHSVLMPLCVLRSSFCVMLSRRSSCPARISRCNTTLDRCRMLHACCVQF